MKKLFSMVAVLTAVFFSTNAAYAEKVYDTELLVVGSGVAGITAAAYASENGVKTIMIEKLPGVGGQLTMIEGTFAVGTPWQRKDMVGLTKSEAFNQTMSYAAWKANSGLVKRIVDESDTAINWLAAKGVEFQSVITDTPDGNRVYHTYKSGNPGKPFVDAMMKVLKANNCVILTEHPAKALIVDKSGNVTGVWAEDMETGEKVRINAKAVLMASGSYAQNIDILLKFNPYFPATIKANGLKGNTGDAITMGQAIGAEVANMDVILSEGAVSTNTNYAELYTSKTMLDAYMILKTQSLWINKNGERFMNEEHSGDYTIVSNSLVANGHSQITIMDATTREDLMLKTGSHTNYFTLYNRGQLITDFDKVVEDGIKRGHAFKANTIEELAKQMKMDPKVVKATVDRYNELARSGEDIDQGKSAAMMKPIIKAPFYAFRGENTICDTAGGLKINRNAQVLHINGQPIKGLYAAGAAAGGMYGNNYPYIMPGFASANALNTGRFAVKHAAETLLGKPIK